jgi:hypothetical protein
MEVMTSGERIEFDIFPSTLDQSFGPGSPRRRRLYTCLATERNVILDTHGAKVNLDLQGAEAILDIQGAVQHVSGLAL